MKILITGANGMVAQAFARHCEEIGDEVLAYTHQELDISDEGKVSEIIQRDKPDAVVNCAAYTDVDGAETNQEVCYAVNAAGVENLAIATKETNCRFLTISTDYVFRGAKEGFYTQDDRPDSDSVYGKAKIAGEQLAKEQYVRSIIVRTGWIFGFAGRNFLSRIKDLLAEGKKIKAIRDSYGTPTFAVDLAKRLRELVESDLSGTFHITNAGSGTSYLGFAEKICKLGNFDKNLIEAVFYNDLKRPAPRPKNSRLKCLVSERSGLSPMPPWENALERFLDKQKAG